MLTHRRNLKVKFLDLENVIHHSLTSFGIRLSKVGRGALEQARHAATADDARASGLTDVTILARLFGSNTVRLHNTGANRARKAEPALDRFRDLGKWPGVFKEEQRSPLISGHHGALCSGAIWYAFYGWKGAPVFDDHAGGGHTITPMAHEGRFSAQAAKTSRYAAAILCLKEATILLENPRAPTPLSKAQRGALTLLPWFNIHYSVAEWEEGDVDRSHALARSMIEAIGGIALIVV